MGKGAKMISMKKFYGIGAILFSIVVIANLWNLVRNWGIMNLPAKISFIAGSILFQCLLVALFLGLKKAVPDMTIKDNNLDDLLKEYKGGKDV